MKSLITLLFVFISLSVFGQQDIEVNRYTNQRELTATHSLILKEGFTVPAGAAFRGYITDNPGPAVNTKLNTAMNGIVIYTAKQSGISNLTDSLNGINQVGVEVQTIDHFGRLKETQQVKVTPGFNDLVHIKEYNAMSNDNVVNQPYVTATGSKNFSDQGYSPIGYSYYVSLNRATSATKAGNGYYEIRYENSPLSPVLEQAAPGDDFSMSNHHTKRSDILPEFAQDYLPGFFAKNDSLKIPLSKYNAHALRTVRTEDENVPYHDLFQSGNSSLMQVSSVGALFETHNYLDQLVAREFQSPTGSLFTYYVYDIKGNLTFVLPPQYPSAGDTVTTANIDALAYQYRYDDQNRMIAKKLPGKGWEYMVYNKVDQVVMTQDAAQRAKAPQQWNVIKYDSQGRPAITGIFVHSGSTSNTDNRAVMQSNVDAKTAQWESRTTSGSGYTNNTYPTSLDTTLSINYYDDYSFAGTNPYPYSTGSTLTRGMATGTLTKVLGTGTMLWTVTYYDDRGRNIKTFKQHYKGGSAAANTNNYDELTTTYDFMGKPLTAIRSHKVSGTETLKILNEYTYDHAGRKLDSWQTINTGTRTLVARNVYDELGMLFKKQLHSTNGTSFLQTITYHYNERGWLTDAEAGSFNLKLRYSQPTKGATPQYNGNIAEQQYQGPQSGNKWFTYKYDDFNRLTEAIYKDTLNNGNGALDEKLTYDLNGNITSLKRGPNPIANYTYDNSGLSNKLMGVSGGNYAGTFTYDVNGNRVTDSKRGVTLTYNQLNLPATVTGNGGASYNYNAAGAKLSSVQGSITREYIDGIQYTDGNIDFIATEEGRAVRNATTGLYSYEYTLKDHLGNARVSFDNNSGTARVIQEDEYYAFGLNQRLYTLGTENKYLYNSKEKQDVLSDELDYGARFYDPVIGRWTSVDPLAEDDGQLSWTPYHYVKDNPITGTDPDGRCGDCIVDIAFTLYDIGEAAYQYAKTGKVEATTKAALAADALAIIIPGVTGSGIGVRLAAKGVNVAEKATEAVKVARAANRAVDAVEAETKVAVREGPLPKPPTGKGSVPPSERDPKRTYTRKETAEMLKEQNGKCKQCDAPKSINEVEGHHVKRHADTRSPSTTKENGAAVCKDCHIKLHKK